MAPAPSRTIGQTPEPLSTGGAAVDPELRAFLEGMEQRLTDKVNAGDAKAEAARRTLEAKMTTIRADIVAVEERAVARDAATRETLEGKIEEARREAGAMMESIIHEIRALPEGLSTFQRQEADRLDAAREKEMLNRHVLPLEASAANHEKRIKAVEQHR